MTAATLYQVFTCANHSAKHFPCSFSVHYHDRADVYRFFHSTSEETRFRISSELRWKDRSVLYPSPLSFFFLLEYNYFTVLLVSAVQQCESTMCMYVYIYVYIYIKHLPQEPPSHPLLGHQQAPSWATLLHSRFPLAISFTHSFIQ